MNTDPATKPDIAALRDRIDLLERAIHRLCGALGAEPNLFIDYSKIVPATPGDGKEDGK